jgi:hypothetical protein
MAKCSTARLFFGYIRLTTRQVFRAAFRGRLRCVRIRSANDE